MTNDVYRYTRGTFANGQADWETKHITRSFANASLLYTGSFATGQSQLLSGLVGEQREGSFGDVDK